MKASRTRYLLGGTAAILLVVFVIAARWYERDAEPPATPAAAGANAGAGAAAGGAELVRDYSPVLGPADARVTLVEFLDPECESCAAMHPIVKEVLREFSGRIRLVVRYMPLHGNSAYAAGLLEGARPHDRFWPLLEEFFAKQPQWADHRAPRPELLAGYARALGLDTRSLEDAARAPETLRRIQQDMADGRALGVRGTPTFFVNGRQLTSLGHAPLRAAVQNALGGTP